MNGGGGSNYIVFQSNGSDDSNLVFFPGGSGDDTIDSFGEDCVIDGDSTDSWGRTSLYGNAGDDFLIPEDSLGYKIGVIADGGAGNDRIETSTYLNSANSLDTLTGGDGEDRFELIFTGVEFDSEAPDERCRDYDYRFCP